MKRNINDSAYLGDLLVTGYSTRNRTFGNMIGKGYTVKSAMMEMSMVSKAITLKAPTISIKDTAQNTIIDAVYQILYEGKDAKRTFKELTDKLD
jgi:glycerol-3-phosphate dehydrogenase (NAD(P)+)